MSGQLVVLLAVFAGTNSGASPAWHVGGGVQAPQEVIIRGRPYTKAGATYPDHSTNVAKVYQPTSLDNSIKRHNVEVTRHQADSVYPYLYSQGFRQLRDVQDGHDNEPEKIYQITKFKPESIKPEIELQVKSKEISPKPDVSPAKPSESTAKPPLAFATENLIGKSQSNLNCLKPEINPVKASESTAKPVLLPTTEILVGQSRSKVNDPVIIDNYESVIPTSQNYGSFQSSISQGGYQNSILSSMSTPVSQAAEYKAVNYNL